MPVTNAVSTFLSIQSFTSSEPGAWSNSYLISGDSEAILFDVFMLHSDAKQIAKPRFVDFRCHWLETADPEDRDRRGQVL